MVDSAFLKRAVCNTYGRTIGSSAIGRGEKVVQRLEGEEK